jgi:phage protein U
MAQTGSFGNIVFEASADRIKTWDRFKRQHKANFATHDVAEGKQKLEYTGFELRPIDLQVRLDARYINPRQEIEALSEILESGEPQVLILGGKPYGEHVLEDFSETWTHTDGQGRVLVARITLKLKEYN